MDVAITAIGTANPAYKQQQLKTAELISNALRLKVSEARLLKSIYKATGIEYRHSVLADYCRLPEQFEFFPNDPSAPFPTTARRMQVYKDNALKLAIDAIRDCFMDTDVDGSAITHLITISCTGMYAPGIDIEIVQQLNFNSSTKRSSINFMGCYGAFNGIKLADSICKADPNANVLVVSVEICTIHFQKKMSMDHMISNAIFADGAAAVLIQANPKQKKAIALSSFYCDIVPQTGQQMAWHIDDEGFDIILSSYVPDTIEYGISSFANRLLTQENMTLSHVDYYAIHPGGLKILQACEAALKITEKDNRYAYHILRQFGNMSSATILFVLKSIWQDISKEDHQKNIFSCAFGPGLTLESMLLRIYHD